MIAAPFAPAEAAALGGPAWLVERRQEALERFEASELPTEAEEEWHYSRVGELELGRFSPPAAGGAVSRAAVELPAPAERLVEALGPLAGLVVSVDGVLADVRLDEKAEAAGLRVARLWSEGTAPSALPGLEEAPDALFLLSEAVVRDGARVIVADRSLVEAPLVVVHVVTDSSSSRLVAPRTLVEVGECAEACVVELLVSGDDLVLVAPSTELRLSAGAQLRYLSAQQLGSRAVQLAFQRSRLERDAVLTSFMAALGGDVARQRTHSVLAGENAEGRLHAIYLADGHQALTFRTVQEHVAPRTRSELVFKGAVADEARSAYSGLVRMHRGARKADASQTNRNLVLSDSARADSVPNLDIKENDVRCSHASAVGPIDPEQRFYLETRGVPSAAAERLVLRGFFEELLEQAPHPGFAAHVREALPARLAAATGGRPMSPIGGR